MSLADVLTWTAENWVYILAGLYALLNVVNAVLKLVPGDQGEGPEGWLAKVRKVLDRVSALTNKDAAGTVKLPVLSKSKPVE